MKTDSDIEALQLENGTLKEQNRTLMEKLEDEQSKVEQLYKDAEALRDELQKEIESYQKTKKQVKAIRKQNKILKRRYIAKLANMDTNYQSSHIKDSYGMSLVHDQNESRKSIEDSLLFEDFSSSDSSDQESSRRLSESILSGSYKSTKTLTSAQKE